MDGGVGGDAVEPKNLVEAEAQQVLQGWALLAAIGLAGDEPIEGGLASDDAVDEFSCGRGNDLRWTFLA